MAGAGSGKTRVLTHRIAHLIQDEGVSPFEILAITFTNKAADEMKQPGRRAGRPGRREDVGVDVPLGLRAHPAARRQGARLPVVVHDLRPGRRRPPHRLRHPRPQPRRQAVPAPVGARHHPRGQERRRRRRASTRERAKTIFERKIADVFTEYQARLLKAGAMDFDDLLGNTVELFREHPEVLEHYQRRFRHVLVDEYQDTNRVQNELVLLLSAESRNVCVVGDTDQCLPPGTLVAHARRARCRSRRSRSATRSSAPPVATSSAAVASRAVDARAATRAGSSTVRAGGRELRGTPHHIVPARMTLDPGRWFVYLMWRADRG